jgi:hypothetical protein
MVFDQFHQAVVRDAIEVTFYIHVYYMHIPLIKKLFNFSKGIFAAASRTKSIA